MSDDEGNFSNIDQFFTEASHLTNQNRSPIQLDKKSGGRDVSDERSDEEEEVIVKPGVDKEIQLYDQPQPTLSDLPTRSFLSDQKNQQEVSFSRQPPQTEVKARSIIDQKSPLTNLSEKAFLEGVKPESAFFLMMQTPSAPSQKATSSKSLRDRQQEHAERMMRESEKRLQSRKELTMLAQTKEMEHCTFQPKIQRASSRGIKVSVKQARAFFDKEINFRAKKEQKIEEELQKRRVHRLLDPARGKPQICPGSAKMAGKTLRSASPREVHERLYENARDCFKALKLDTSGNKEPDDVSLQISTGLLQTPPAAMTKPFTPSINRKSANLRRSYNVTTLLQQDALRRQKKQEMPEAPPRVPLVSKRSEHLMFEKFEQQLRREVGRLDERGVVSYSEFPTLLSNLGFIFTDSFQISKQVPELMYDLWECVCQKPYVGAKHEESGVQSGATNFYNLLIVLSGVLNFHFSWMYKPQEQNETISRVYKEFGVKFLESGEVSLSAAGQQQVHSHFKTLYYIFHKNYTQARKQRSMILPPASPSFSPALCPGSKRINQPRSKSPHTLNYEGFYFSPKRHEASSTKQARHDLLLAKGQEYRKRQESRRKMKSELEKATHSFKPKILGEEAAAKVLMRSSSSGPLRGLKELDDILKERAKAVLGTEGSTGGAGPGTNLHSPASRIERLATPKRRLQIPKEDLEYIRNREHCSFQPQTRKKRVIKKGASGQLPRHLLSEAAVNDHMEELKQAAHDQVQQEMDRHYLESKESSTREVILEMSVKLEDGRASELLVHEGETAEEATAIFAQKMGLREDLKRKLQGLVDEQLKAVLSRIVEEQEDISR